MPSQCEVRSSSKAVWLQGEFDSFDFLALAGAEGRDEWLGCLPDSIVTGFEVRMRTNPQNEKDGAEWGRMYLSAVDNWRDLLWQGVRDRISASQLCRVVGILFDIVDISYRRPNWRTDLSSCGASIFEELAWHVDWRPSNWNDPVPPFRESYKGEGERECLIAKEGLLGSVFDSDLEGCPKVRITWKGVSGALHMTTVTGAVILARSTLMLQAKPRIFKMSATTIALHYKYLLLTMQSADSEDHCWLEAVLNVVSIHASELIEKKPAWLLDSFPCRYGL